MADAVRQAIDVWNAGTFDPELLDALRSNADLIRRYIDTDNRIFLEYDLERGSARPVVRPSNPFAAPYYSLLDDLNRLMVPQTSALFTMPGSPTMKQPPSAALAFTSQHRTRCAAGSTH